MKVTLADGTFGTASGVKDPVGNILATFEPVLQSKTVNLSDGQTTINPDSGYDGLSQVIAIVNSGGSDGESISLPNGLVGFNKQTVTIETTISYDTTDGKIPHGAGFKPDIVFMARVDAGSHATTGIRGMTFFNANENIKNYGSCFVGDDGTNSKSINPTVLNADDTYIYYQPASNDYRIYEGTVFEIVSIKIDNVSNV